ncbi:MAG: hypothetical protein H3C47_11230 [Candidatus Cloacimonetes bacterium]|nr:hypothetical protein [Candidatus Cloacimonadota bacterium]
MKPPIKSIMTNGEKPIELLLTKTEVIMRLSEEALEEIELEAESAKIPESSPQWAHKFKDWVLGGIFRILKKQISYSLDEIKDIQIIDHKLVFSYHSKPHMISFEDVCIGVGPALEQFSESDCQKFIEAFYHTKQEFLKYLEHSI